MNWITKLAICVLAVAPCGLLILAGVALWKRRSKPTPLIPRIASVTPLTPMCDSERDTVRITYLTDEELAEADPENVYPRVRYSRPDAVIKSPSKWLPK